MVKEKKEKPDWYRSDYRGSWDWNTNMYKVAHEKRLRCPYCGKEMHFASPIFYEYRSSDWYWFCEECALQLPNKGNFTEEELDAARIRYRLSLEKEMKEAKAKYERTKNLYNAYGRYFTPEEKRKRLIETIEKHKPLGDVE